MHEGSDEDECDVLTDFGKNCHRQLTYSSRKNGKELLCAGTCISKYCDQFVNTLFESVPTNIQLKVRYANAKTEVISREIRTVNISVGVPWSNQPLSDLTSTFPRTIYKYGDVGAPSWLQMIGQKEESKESKEPRWTWTARADSSDHASRRKLERMFGMRADYSVFEKELPSMQVRRMLLCSFLKAHPRFVLFVSCMSRNEPRERLQSPKVEAFHFDSPDQVWFLPGSAWNALFNAESNAYQVEMKLALDLETEAERDSHRVERKEAEELKAQLKERQRQYAADEERKLQEIFKEHERLLAKSGSSRAVDKTEYDGLRTGRRRNKITRVRRR